jgi:hypothetical protein
MTTAPMPSEVLLTTAHVAAMRDEYARAEKELADLDRRREEIEARREAAKAKLTQIEALLSLLGITSPTVDKEAAGEPPSSPVEEVAEPRPSRRGKGKRVGWADHVLAALKGGPFQSLTHPDLRAAIMEGPLADNLRESEKGYYNALARLQKSGEVAKEGARLFTREGLSLYKQAKANGEIDESFVSSFRPSPMADSILLFVEKEGPYVTAAAIVAHLKADHRFAGVVGRNPTAAYNVLARLIQRGQLVKGDGGYSVPEMNEAPANAEAPLNPGKDETGTFMPGSSDADTSQQEKGAHHE